MKKISPSFGPGAIEYAARGCLGERQVAAILDVPLRVLRKDRLRAKPRIPFVHVSPRFVVYEPEALREYLRAQVLRKARLEEATRRRRAWWVSLEQSGGAGGSIDDLPPDEQERRHSACMRAAQFLRRSGAVGEISPQVHAVTVQVDGVKDAVKGCRE